eukprot:6931778-Ditylum_brightwellii.AAC.1
MIGTPVTDPAQVDLPESQNRLKYLFGLMIRAIATPSQPLFLFLDDLQWADSSSLSFIKSVLTNSESKCFLFIGSYRNDQSSDGHPFAEFLSDISTRNIPVTKIALDNICRGDVNDLISDVICMPKSQTKSLSDIVYQKTGGNVLFVNQFLKSLYNEGLLQFSLDSDSWEWDIASIQMKTIPEDVVRLLASGITMLPAQTQRVLMLLSCIGSVCAESTLSLFINDTDLHWNETTKVTTSREEDISSSLEVAIGEGLLNKE